MWEILNFMKQFQKVKLTTPFYNRGWWCREDFARAKLAWRCLR